MTSGQFRVSVIIPTYNRSKRLVNLLIALEKQTFQEFETIVIDDGSTDSTHSALDSRAFSLKSLRLFTQKNQGHAVARNQGVKEASGSLLIFFDSDVRPISNCVRKHIDHHENYSGTILTGLATLDSSIAQKNDITKYRDYVEKVRWFRPPHGNKVQVDVENYRFSTQNLSLSKETFYLLNGFDERLKDSVDFDLSVSALIKNIPIYYDYNAVVWHDDYVDFESYINRQLQYEQARNKIGILKPEYIKIIPDEFINDFF